jgi:DUF2934 family protein
MAKATEKSVEKLELPSGELIVESSASAGPGREEIELRAYEIYVQRGREDGGDVRDWLEAESELVAEAALAKKGAKAAAA